MITSLLLVLNGDVDERKPWDLNVDKNIAIVILTRGLKRVLRTYSLCVNVFKSGGVTLQTFLHLSLIKGLDFNGKLATLDFQEETFLCF